MARFVRARTWANARRRRQRRGEGATGAAKAPAPSFGAGAFAIARATVAATFATPWRRPADKFGQRSPSSSPNLDFLLERAIADSKQCALIREQMQNNVG